MTAAFEAAFAARVAASVRRVFGEREELASRVNAAIAAARGYGLSTERELVRFAHVTFLLGDGWDTAEPWARAILGNAALTPSRRIDAAWKRIATE
ncbi:MAG TPA: hypothetical protein VEU30_09800 [Thermoanaerobaculia bacterium]|nr:hypothetical protein [Thermoanaerobaculia bacterium]